MKRPSPKLLTVLQTVQVSPNMQRITLHGNDLAEFPKSCEGGYLKLLFNHTGGTDLSALTEKERPKMRTYTIRRYLADQSAIEIDFVRHTTHDMQCGFASRWAMNVSEGETIHFVGPGQSADLNTDANWFFMAADMTALPALSAKIRKLPESSKGYAVIKVIDNKDIQPINAPKNFEVIWLTEQTPLAERVRALQWLDGDVAVWVACEFDIMRELRHYFRNEKGVDRANIYISSYWKQGVSEDGHKLIKMKDSEEYGK